MGLDQTSPAHNEGKRSGDILLLCSCTRLAIYKKGFILAISNYQATSQSDICSILYIVQYYISFLPPPQSDAIMTLSKAIIISLAAVLNSLAERAPVTPRSTKMSGRQTVVCGEICSFTQVSVAKHVIGKDC